jgi:ACR3 family arsenite efflux pump ArsB
MPQPRILIAATACVLATALAIARGGIGGGAAVIVVVVLLVFVRVAFRLVDAAERREEDRAGRHLGR